MNRPRIDSGDAVGSHLLADAEKQDTKTEGVAPQAWLRFLRHLLRSDRLYSHSLTLAWHQYVIDMLPKEIHRKNPDYAAIWIGLAQCQALSDKCEARTTFKYMKLERIGLDLPLFYECWSELEMRSGSVTKAKAITAQGKRRLAGQNAQSDLTRDTQQFTQTMASIAQAPVQTPSLPLSSTSNEPTTATLMTEDFPSPACNFSTANLPGLKVITQTTLPSITANTVQSNSSNTAPIERSRDPPIRRFDWSQLSPSPEKPEPAIKASNALPTIPKKKIRFEDAIGENPPVTPKIPSSSDKENLSAVPGQIPPALKPPTAASAVSSPHRSVLVNGISYLILEMVGKGGSGQVYKVVGENKQIYAVKRVKLNDNPDALESIRNEIRLLQKLKGRPAIIELVDSQEALAQNVIWMVFEFGEIDLARMLRNQNGQSMNINYIRTYWQQMLEAVQTIHGERVVHSDLKPANFMIVKGCLKLIDFGIALAIQGDDTTHIVRHSQIGTINYMAPEAITGPTGGTKSFKLGRPSDIWSLGCILYQMVYGRTPFHDLNFVQKLHAITDPKHPIPFDIPSLIPEALLPDVIDVIRLCLNRVPSQRPTIPELLRHRFLTTVPLTTPVPAVTKDQLQSLIAQLASSGLSSADLTNPSVVDAIHWQLQQGIDVNVKSAIVDISKERK
uniref:Protein kinase domain-containing protein n=1 Tax=Spongospora subterranea TaxID=70186 RepID=A0A0H5QVP1_9EUKA|eukprot:CRZ05792.1 hypothetical protein [Spongospora subterranea]